MRRGLWRGTDVEEVPKVSVFEVVRIHAKDVASVFVWVCLFGAYPRAGLVEGPWKFNQRLLL